MSAVHYESWGRYPKHNPAGVIKLFWKDEIPRLDNIEGSVLPYGCGKSYGDSCQNSGGILLDTRGLNRLISFDEKEGVLKCEAGVTLSAILDFAVPRGWFLAVTPGTKHITIAGAIANDVHGKNHHRAGSFGCWVNCFELLRSNGERFLCSNEENPDLFRATIGGLGITGLITWVEIRLKPCPSAFFYYESIKFDNLDEFFLINADSDSEFEYTVSWVDTSATDGSLGRGIYMRGNHASPDKFKLPDLPKPKQIPMPIQAPFINSCSVNLFNLLYYHKQFERKISQVAHYDPFFYPLDAISNWNLAYGKNGFLQYQFVVPFGSERDSLKRMLRIIARSGMSSFLTVLKTMGDKPSPGMMSFPRPGVIMAIDFRMTGEPALKLLSTLDEIVVDVGGILYPAKDARMSARDFQLFYPQWREFSKFIDPKFSSSFWRRVIGN
ncbi:MAG: linked oxidase domain protein [Ignavibacteria bacterium]|nr:linked oxidase domain protein [Ignavibacteria bacterium]